MDLTIFVLVEVKKIPHRRALTLRASTRLRPFGFPDKATLCQERRVYKGVIKLKIAKNEVAKQPKNNNNVLQCVFLAKNIGREHFYRRALIFPAIRGQAGLLRAQLAHELIKPPPGFGGDLGQKDAVIERSAADDDAVLA